MQLEGGSMKKARPGAAVRFLELLAGSSLLQYAAVPKDVVR
jgi:hypothetical protein